MSQKIVIAIYVLRASKGLIRVEGPAGNRMYMRGLYRTFNLTITKFNSVNFVELGLLVGVCG